MRVSEARNSRPRRRLLLHVALPLAAAAALTAALLPGSGSALALVPPSNTTEPTIVGDAIEGRTLTANRGTWAGSTPMSFAYRWLRCPTDGGANDGSNCAPIPGGSGDGSTYRLRDADVGIRIRVRVTATNADGSATAVSNPTAIVQGSARPRVVEPPTISGSPVLGATQTADPGTWSGTQPITFSYQWRTCNASGGNCSSISGATSKTFVARQADVGRTLRVRVTARNNIGTETATSAPTAVILAEAATGCPSGSGPISIGQLTPPARLLVDGFRVSPNPIPLSTGRLVVRFHVSACGGRSVDGATIYVTAVPFNQFAIPPEQQTGADGWTTLRMDRLGGFPAADNQSLLVMFVRARKSGEPVLAGVSTRRLISFRLTRSARFTARTEATRTPSAPKVAVAATACPAGSGPVNVEQVTPPARLLVDRFQVSPSPVPLATTELTVRIHVSACGGRDVSGALVYSTAVPFNQFSIPDEGRTGADGWTTLHMNRLSGFPAAKKQTLLVMFLRARKGGEPVLAGISTRRLISFRLAK
ncbi:MAG TPA: hypothetical protein VFR32_08275 [Gaiellaceae bacterium]|nr:hypothetical protein [Gaiellaceae bacterium]